MKRKFPILDRKGKQVGESPDIPPAHPKLIFKSCQHCKEEIMHWHLAE